MHPILIHPGLPQEKTCKADIFERQTGMEVFEPEDRDEVASTLESIDEPVAFLCANRDWDDTYLDQLSDQDWVTSVGAGYDNYAVNEFKKRDITFTNTPGIHDQPIGEHVFGLLFCVSRGLFWYHQKQQEGAWQKNLDTTDYANDTCCIIGLGRIGEGLARRASAFDMHVRGVKRTVEGYDGAAHEVYPSDELHAALDGAQVVIVAVPLSEETKGMIDSDALSNLAGGAVLANIARGPVVETDALTQALDDGQLETAILDVFDTEPLPKESPLWERDDVVITPHAAATTDKSVDRLLDVFMAQYERWNAGSEMEHVISP